MPPKKKIVKKTVRKAKPKAQNQTQSSPPPEPQPEPEPVPESSPPAGATATATATETPMPAAEETVVAEPTSTETLEPQSDAATAMATETLEKEPEPTSETLAEEPAAMEATGSEVPAEEPAAAGALEEPAAEAAGEPSETGKKPKTVTKVRKVVKKKIVKKIVPKTAAAAKEESKLVQYEAAPDQDSTVEQPEIENPRLDDAPAPMETVPETAAVDTEVADAEKLEDAEKAVDAEKAEDALKEEEKGGDLEMEVPGDEEAGISERISRRKTEIFIGGLDRDAKEEDLRKVFGEVGEIVEVRMIMDGQSGKNKGYAFLRYADASHAKKAVAQFEKVEVCGKLCGASALKGNDTIFLGNIDKKWKKEDIIKLLLEVGIDKIEAVTVMPDSNNVDSNRGFAFLELETNKDAQNAYKKLQKKDAFGKGRNIKVAWAEPLNDPDEEEMKKVKSVYAEGIPASWNEEKVKESFKKFGEIERIVLARNIKSSKRKDFAFVNYKTREAALSCIESFDKEELTDNGSKVNVKVSLAKPTQKNKQNKVGSKFTNKDSLKEKPNVHQRDTKPSISLSKGKSSGGGYPNSGHMRSSTNHELLHVLREQATWKQGQVGYARGPPLHDYTQHGVEGKRTFSSLGDEALYSDMRGYPRARLDSFPSTGSSYGAMPHGTGGPSHPYYQRQGPEYSAGARYGASDYPAAHQMRQGAPPPYGSSYYSRY